MLCSVFREIFVKRTRDATRSVAHRPKIIKTKFKICQKRPKMASNTEKIVLSTLMDSLREIIECPICTNIPINGRYHQCKNGHVCCLMCKPKLQQCPSCREPIDGRCLKLEDLSELVPRQCKFSQGGCKIELVPSLLGNHQIHCQQKLLQCPNVLCLTKILPEFLDEHAKVGVLRASHKISDSKPRIC
jgi:hypothetical protein